MIEIRNLSHTIDGFHLDRVSFLVREGEYFVILGPTGSGKTILLEYIAGVHPNSSGAVWINGQDVSAQTPEERNLGYVPQDYVLFPFLSVEENILFPLRVRHKLDEEALTYFRKIVGLLTIDHLLKRQIQKLSGGEKQRVALARALVTKPNVLLLDEPYAALHAGLRRRLWVDMRLLHRLLGTTVVHVTHDLEEAFALGRRAVVLINGKLEQIGTRNEILHHPNSEKVAVFLGIVNVFRGSVVKIDSHHNCVCIHYRDYKISAPLKEKLSVGDEIGFCIRGEQVEVSADEFKLTADDESNHFRARLVVSVSHGNVYSLYFKILASHCTCAEYDLEVRLPIGRQKELNLREGQEAMLTIRKDAIHIFS